jgi:hypothetical protein
LVIQSLDLPSQVEVGKDYTYNVVLANDEDHSLTVSLKRHSSVTGFMDTDVVKIPANGTKTVSYTTVFESAGLRTLTLTAIYKDSEISRLEKIVEAIPPILEQQTDQSTELKIDPKRYHNYRQLVKNLVIAIVFGGGIIYCLRPEGVFSEYLNLDLDFMIPPILGYIIFRLFSRLSIILLPSRTGLYIAPIMDGIAFSLFSYFFSKRLGLLSDSLNLSISQELLKNLEYYASYTVFFFTGVTCVRLANLLSATSWQKKIRPLITAIGYLIIGFSLLNYFTAFSNAWPSIKGIELVLFYAMLATSISSLGFYGENANNRLIADISRWLSSGPVGKFLLGGLIASYILFIRPAIFSATEYAYLIEWAVVCFISLLLLIAIKNSLKNFHSIPEKESEWHRHVQKVNDIVDTDFSKLINLQRNFVNNGEREKLLSYLTRTLENNNFDESEIKQTLQTIIEYNDRKIPWYVFIAFGFWERSILKNNLKKRRNVLDETMFELGTVLHPST